LGSNSRICLQICIQYIDIYSYLEEQRIIPANISFSNMAQSQICRRTNLNSSFWSRYTPTEQLILMLPRKRDHLSVPMYSLVRFERQEVPEVKKIRQCVTKITAIHTRAVSNQGHH
jgi:hypothetical protein